MDGFGAKWGGLRVSTALLDLNIAMTDCEDEIRNKSSVLL
jgi:hypothetical protein